MTSRAAFALLAILLAEDVAAQRSIGCPTGFSPPQTVTANTQYCYKFINFGTGVSWVTAKQACYNAGGTMAAFRNAEEAAAVVTNFCAGLGAANQAIWLGLYVPSAFPGTYSACRVSALGRSNPCYDRTNWAWENGADRSFYLANNAAYWMGTDSYGWREPDDFGCAALNGGDERTTNLMGDLACDYDSTYPQFYTSPFACCEAAILPTPSVTASPSVSRSPSVTPTVTRSVTVSPTVSPTGSVTPTETASVTVSRTASRSVSVTSSRTASSTVSVSVSITTTVTSSPSVSSSVSPSSSVSSSPSSSPSSSSSLSVSPSESSSVSATVSESPSASLSVSASITASPSVSPSTSQSASPSETPLPPAAVFGVGNLNGIGASDVNGTGLIVPPEESTNGVVVMAGAGLGALIAIIAALCCLWWCLLLPARRRKAEAEARRKKLSRPSTFARSARNLGGKGKGSGGLAGALELPSGGKSGAGAAAGGLAAKQRGGGGARAAFGPSGTGNGSDFALMNPALLTAKRGSMVPGAVPAVAARAPRMTMALAAYKKPLALQTRKRDYGEDDGDVGDPSAGEHEAIGLVEDEEAGAGDANGGGWNNGGYGENGADAGAGGDYDYSGYEGYDEHGNYIGDGTNYDYSGYEGYGAAAEADAPAEDYQDEDAPLDDDADADDYMDEDEAILGVAAKKGVGKKATGGGYLSRKAKKAAPAASLPPLPEPKKLVIGKGTLVSEKVETQVIKLRRVSKIKGDSTLTEMRKQSAKISRPSAAVMSGFGPTAAGSSRNLLDTGGLSAGGAYTFAATVARFKVKADTARAAAAAKRGSVAAKRSSVAAKRTSVAAPAAPTDADYLVEQGEGHYAAGEYGSGEYAEEYAGGEYGSGYAEEYTGGEYGSGYAEEYAGGEYGSGYAEEYAGGEYATGEEYAGGEYATGEEYTGGEYATAEAEYTGGDAAAHR